MKQIVLQYFLLKFYHVEIKRGFVSNLGWTDATIIYPCFSAIIHNCSSVHPIFFYFTTKKCILHSNVFVFTPGSPTVAGQSDIVQTPVCLLYVNAAQPFLSQNTEHFIWFSLLVWVSDGWVKSFLFGDRLYPEELEAILDDGNKYIHLHRASVIYNSM